MHSAHRRLMFHGMVLFLLGLLLGLAEPTFKNVRMGLAAHLEGVLNGTFLLALGAAWREVRLSDRAAFIAFWTAVFGAYANVFFTTLAAIFGTVALSPITGPSHAAAAWQETLVRLGFTVDGISILIASGILVWGFRGRNAAIGSTGGTER